MALAITATIQVALAALEVVAQQIKVRLEVQVIRQVHLQAKVIMAGLLHLALVLMVVVVVEEQVQLVLLALSGLEALVALVQLHQLLVLL
jgi:hypothetical protein